MKFEDFKQQVLKNTEVKTEYDQLSPQYELIRQIIKLRQEQQLTQKGLAEKTGIPLIAQASSLVPLQSIVVSELAKSRGKLTNKVYRKSDIWR